MRRLIAALFTILVVPSTILAAPKSPTKKTVLGQERKVTPNIPNGSDTAQQAVFFLNAGWKALESWRTNDAVRYFQKASRLSPNDPQVFWGIAVTYSQFAKFPESIAWFEQAERKLPKVARLLSDFGFTYLGYGVLTNKSDSPKAKQDAERYWSAAEDKLMQAASLSPHDALIFSRLAMLNFYKEQYAQSWQHVKKSRSLGGAGLDEQFLSDLKKRAPEPKS